MTNKAKKKRVVVDLYGHKTQMDRQYHGRLLGFITSEEFNALVNNKSLQSKFLTAETMPVEEIADNYAELDGLRIVVAVKKIDGKDVVKQLFVSEPLDTVSYYYPEKSEIGFTTDDNNIVMIVQSEVG